MSHVGISEFSTNFLAESIKIISHIPVLITYHTNDDCQNGQNTANLV